MFVQRSSLISIFRKALFFRTLHHLLCLLDLLAFLFLPVVVLPFMLILHLVVFVGYLNAMTSVCVQLAAQKCAASEIVSSEASGPVV